jgi:hypothetical protein
MCDMQCATLHVRGSKALLGLGSIKGECDAKRNIKCLLTTYFYWWPIPRKSTESLPTLVSEANAGAKKSYEELYQDQGSPKHIIHCFIYHLFDLSK